MKKLIAVLAISSAFVACNNSTSTTTATDSTTNSAAPATVTTDTTNKMGGDSAHKMADTVKTSTTVKKDSVSKK